MVAPELVCPMLGDAAWLPLPDCERALAGSHITAIATTKKTSRRTMLCRLARSAEPWQCSMVATTSSIAFGLVFSFCSPVSSPVPSSTHYQLPIEINARTGPPHLQDNAHPRDYWAERKEKLEAPTNSSNRSERPARRCPVWAFLSGAQWMPIDGELGRQPSRNARRWRLLCRIAERWPVKAWKPARRKNRRGG